MGEMIVEIMSVEEDMPLDKPTLFKAISKWSTGDLHIMVGQETVEEAV